MKIFNKKNETKKYKRRKYKTSQFLICLILLTALFVPLKNEVFFLNPISKSLKLKANPPAIGEVGRPEIGDVVYYNQLYAEDAKNEKYQKAIIHKGDAKNPGWGGDLGDWDEWNQNNWSERTKKEKLRDQIVDITSNPDEKLGTTWRVWDILADGSYVLISNKLVSDVYIQGPVGYLWWEHTAHLMASTYGFGFGANTNATKNFKYSVGSKIDTAPDMTEGDKGIWHIGKNGIPISGSRALTIEDVEEKLGIDEEKINSGYMNITPDGSAKYNQKVNTRWNFIPQRDIGSKKQRMDDEIESSMYDYSKPTHTVRNKAWILKQKDINFENLDEESKNKNPNLLKYKSMLFDDKLRMDMNGHGLLANTGIVLNNTGGFSLGTAYVSPSSSRLGFISTDAIIVSSNYGKGYDGRPEAPKKRGKIFVLTYLRPNLVFERAAIDPKYELPEGLKAWDIKIEKNKKDINFIVNNYAKENAQNLNIDLEKEIVEKDIVEETKIEKIEFTGMNQEKEKYSTKITKYAGGTRKDNIDDAKFNPIDNKYKLSITNLPEGYDFKIIDRNSAEIGGTHGELKKEIDLRNDVNNMVGDNGYEYDLIVFPKNKDISIPVVYEGGKKDENFEVEGNIKVTTGDTNLDKTLSDELKNKSVTLKHGVDSINLKDIPLFNHLKNKLTTIKIEFSKNEKDKGKHIVTIGNKSEGEDVALEEIDQIKVKYVPEKINIKANLKDDSDTNLQDLDMYLVSKEPGKDPKKKDIKIKLDGTILDANGNAIESLDKTTDDGEKITYSLEKKQIVLGNVVEIKEGKEIETENGTEIVFNIRVRPLLKLPMTGKDNLTKVVIAATTLMILSFISQSTSKRSIFYEEYSIIK